MHSKDTAQEQMWHATAQMAHLKESILCQCHERNGCCGDEHASDRNEAAYEDEQTQQTYARDLQNPHPQDCQGGIGQRNLCLQCTIPSLRLLQRNSSSDTWRDMAGGARCGDACADAEVDQAS